MKNRTALFAGLALFLSFCLLSVSGKITAALAETNLLLGMLVAELVAFVLPLLLVKLGANKKDGPVRLRTFLKISSPSVVWFTLAAGIAMAILTFLINYAFLRGGAGDPVSLAGFAGQEGDLRLLLALTFLLVPPVCEELFLRGAVLSAHEQLAGTGWCIALSGLCFAMLHGSMQNFFGPLLAGVLYAFMTYSFDCVWPAVLAHVINNLYYVGVLWLTDTYSAFGIWKYFPGISLIAFLAFAYLAFHALETLLATDHIRRFRKPEGEGAGLLAIALNPGFTVFVLAFLTKAVLHLF